MYQTSSTIDPYIERAQSGETILLRVRNRAALHEVWAEVTMRYTYPDTGLRSCTFSGEQIDLHFRLGTGPNGHILIHAADPPLLEGGGDGVPWVREEARSFATPLPSPSSDLPPRSAEGGTTAGQRRWAWGLVGIGLWLELGAVAIYSGWHNGGLALVPCLIGVVLMIVGGCILLDPPGIED